MYGEWIEVKVVINPEALEPVTGIFYSLDVKGVAIEDPNDISSRESGPMTWDFADINILEYGDSAAVIKGYFSEEDNIEEIITFIKEKLAELTEFGINIEPGLVMSNKIFEEDWANNWKKYYKPVRIGKNMVIKPLWEDYELSESDIEIALDPGMAFGTGTHETTRMCVEALEKYVTKEATVFDIGTGSGILAIAAAKLGAKKVIGVDLDPVAVTAAKENVSYNNVPQTEILLGNLTDVIEGKAEIVVANIIADVIIFLSDEVKNFILPEGLFITSGIIKDRQEDVVSKLKASNFDILEVKNEGEWVCIVSKA